MKQVTHKQYSIGLTFLPPFVYYTFLLHHALNVPVGDDFVVILKFLLEWDWATDSISQKWSLLTQNFIDHRLVYTRLSALLIRFLLGNLDFRGIMLAGNLTLLGLMWLLTRPLAAAKLSWWYYLPVSLLIFQPIAYEGNFWAIASTNYMPVCFLSLLCLYLLHKPQPGMVFWALLTAIGATLTFANGLLLWPIGCVLLFINNRRQALVWWLLATIIAIALYFYNFSYSNQPYVLQNLFHRCIAVSTTFFMMVGACAGWDDKNHLFAIPDLFQLFVGISSCCWLVYVIGKQALQTTPSVFKELTAQEGISIDYLSSFGLFLLASCALFAIGRSVDGYVVTESRYRHFSVFLLAVCYVYVVILAKPEQRSIFYRSSLLIAFLFCMSSYLICTPRLEAMQRKTKAGLYNWQRNKHWLIYRDGGYYLSVADTISQWVDQHAQNWYRFPTYFTAAPLAKSAPPDNSIRISNFLSPAAQTIRVHYPINQPVSGEPYIYLQSDKKIWLLEAYQPTSIRHLAKHGRYRTPCIKSDFSIQNYSTQKTIAGNYQLGVLFVSPNKTIHAVHKPGFTLLIQ